MYLRKLIADDNIHIIPNNFKYEVSVENRVLKSTVEQQLSWNEWFTKRSEEHTSELQSR